MAIWFTRLDAPLGAEIKELDPGALESPDEQRLRDALAEHAVLVARDLDLTPDRQVALTRVFGDAAVHPIESIRLDGVPEVIDLHVKPPKSLADEDSGANEQVVGHIPWHSDLTYTAEPSRGALLYAVDVPPEGGDTGYIDTVRVYDALPDEIKERIRDLQVVHSFDELGEQERRALSQGRDGAGAGPDFDAVVHPMVHCHPPTGRLALNISPLFARTVLGMSDEDSHELLAELESFATQDRFTYYHRWQAGDLVMWDNWRTMHTATGHKRRYGRRMLRTTISGALLTPAA
jgi:taurine dioxygenase